jgi:anti-anti-sigma factor
MPITHTRNNQLCSIAISGEMSIYTAKLTQTTLLELLHTEDQIHIDLSEVSDIDSTGIQLLLSIKNFANAQNIPLQFHGHSQCVLNVIDLYNIAAELGDPLVLTQR